MTDPDDPVLKELRALRREVDRDFYVSLATLVILLGLLLLASCAA